MWNNQDVLFRKKALDPVPGRQAGKIPFEGLPPTGGIRSGMPNTNGTLLFIMCAACGCMEAFPTPAFYPASLKSDTASPLGRSSGHVRGNSPCY